MKKMRPLGDFSNYIVEGLPLDLERNPENILPMIKKLMPNSKKYLNTLNYWILPSREKSHLALLDLKIAERTLEVLGKSIPEQLSKIVTTFSKRKGVPAIVTYEELVLINPKDDLRLFKTGDVGESERLFYETHRIIENSLDITIQTIYEFMVGTTYTNPYIGTSFVQRKSLKETIAIVKHQLGNVNTLLKNLFGLDINHFNAFRQFLTESKNRSLKGPSGAFTAKIPILQMVTFGKDCDKAYMQYVKDNFQYFPKPDHSLLKSLIKLAEGKLPKSHVLNVCLNEESSRENVTKLVKEFLLEFRKSHYGVVKKMLPDDVKGTAGESPKAFLGERIKETKKLPPQEKAIQIAPAHYISRVIKGGWQLAGGHGQVDSEKALEDMFLYMKKGIYTFDCADIYTGVEELIGNYQFALGSRFTTLLKQKPHVHTKFVPDRDILSEISEEYIEEIINRSKDRLKVEAIDLVQFHWWDFEQERYLFSFQKLLDLQSAGKIKFLGLTNFDVKHTLEILKIGKIVSNQVQYSILDRRPENGMTDLAKRENFHLLCYGTIAGGFLSKRFLGVPEPDIQTLENRSLVKYKLIIDEFGGWELFQKLLLVLEKIGCKHNVSISSVASRYILEKPRVAAVIIGARNAKYVDEYSQLFSFYLDSEDYNLINEILDQSKGPAGDIYSVEREKDSPHYAIMRYNLNRS